MTEQHGDPNEYDHWGYKDYLITKPLQRPLRPERTRPPRPLGGNYQETQETTTTTTRPSKINRRPPGNLREIRIRPKHHDHCPFLARCTIVTTNVSPCTRGIQRYCQNTFPRFWQIPILTLTGSENISSPRKPQRSWADCLMLGKSGGEGEPIVRFQKLGTKNIS